MDDGTPTQPKPKWWSRSTLSAASTPDPSPAPGSPTAAPEDTTPAATAEPAAPARGGHAAEPATSDGPVPAATPAAGEAPGIETPTAQAPRVGTPAAQAPGTEATEGGTASGAAPGPAGPGATGTTGTHPTATAPQDAPGAPYETSAPAPVPATPAPAPPTASPADRADGADGGDGVAPVRSGPLHAPDEYRTPPYGEPGPWAPAPPVQRPVPPAPPVTGPAPSPAPAPPAPAHAHATTPAAAPGQWAQYDPWSSPAAPPSQPLAVSPTGAWPRRRPRRGLALAGALVFALLTGVVGGAVGAYVERNGGLNPVELPQAGAAPGDRAPDSVAGIAARALPSVVTLHVSGGGEQGTGTGFVLDRRGHILTNHHVVDSADGAGDISVTFSGGETARATLVGGDSGYDLAVVRVTGVSNLAPLQLGDSDGVRVGDPVVAIGAPFDLRNTVTSGIISAKGRPITAGGEKGGGGDVSYVDALQTDAPINPGNSGGPLLDAQARVIGVNSAIRAADSGSALGGGQSGSIGLGFAIPINQGRRVAEELINTGKATHPVIGVSLDMKFAGDGARVADKAQDGTASVTAGGPAAEAGVRPGDVITEVDGERVHSGEELIVKIRAHRPGDALRLTVERNGREQEKTLTLGSSADN
ncbi:trypsin-like peptidase domain-containing protein [Streptomyces kanasensis]|uniref:trypsin-like peptidase domain-containing protein n=1 Tax=Streptomyces kanasensis TaxID=936756 RepID=UPI0036FF81DF